MSRKKKKKNRIKYFLIGLGVTLGIIYLAVAVYFMGHFAFGTSVNGRQAYGTTARDQEDIAAQEASSYELVIHGRNGVSDVITSKQLQITPEFDDEFRQLLKQQKSLLWPMYLFKETDLVTETLISYSQAELSKLVAELSVFDEENIIEPVNAYISDESGENGFDIVAADDGAKPLGAMVLSEIKGAVDILAPEITLSDACYDRAAVDENDAYLVELRDNLNSFCTADIIYKFGDDTVNVNGTMIKQWCNIDDTNVSLDEDKVRQFVQDLARKYDTFGSTRTLKTHAGDIIDVKGGDYGWWMNRGQEADELIEAIKSGYKGNRTPVYYGTGASYGENDYGNTYVEINLDAQHLWVYEEGRMVEESDFVSGCVNKRTTTPVGTYAITYKERDATLNGENYSSPVDFWMPFNGNVGMHDASWRSSFGGEIYVTNGSHGCINLPRKKAEAIFEIVKKGEPVLVYGGKVLPEKEEETEADPEEQLLQLLLMQQAAAAEAPTEIVNE